MKKTIAWLLIVCCLIAFSACNAASDGKDSDGKDSGGKDFGDFFQKPTETEGEDSNLAPTTGAFDDNNDDGSVVATTSPNVPAPAPTVAPNVQMPTVAPTVAPDVSVSTMPTAPAVEATMPSPTAPAVEEIIPGDRVEATVAPTIAPMPVPTEPVETEPAEEEQGIQVLSWPKTIDRNTVGKVEIQGKPNTEYTIKVYYKSGLSSAAGLEPKIADSEGYVTWSWKVHSRTTPGTYKIVIEGNGEEYTLVFTVL